MNKEHEAEWIHHELLYKTGEHGKIYVYLNGEWRLSNKDYEEIRTGVRTLPQWPTDNSRIDAIGQNGGDGLHYSALVRGRHP